MIQRIVAELGAWNWVVLGFILLGIEILAPGVFLLWIGLAALTVGIVSLMIWDASLWTWQVQVMLFLVLSVVFVLVGRRMGGSEDSESDQPLLNRRADALVGRTAILDAPIENGFGRVRLDDTVWRVSGPDLPAGTRVRVTAAKQGELAVESA